MIRSLRAFIVAAAIAVLSSTVHPAFASKPVDQGHFTLDPAMGYILARVGPVSGRGGVSPLYFVRLNLEKPGATMWAFGQSSIDSRRQLDAAIIFGHDHWGTDGATSLFLVPVNPGRWAIGGAGNTSFSLGSWGFDVRPGEITYIGTILIGRQDGRSPIPEIAASRLSQDLVEFGSLMNIVMSDTALVRPPAAGDALPAGLSTATIRRAELIPDVRFDNFLRALVGRALGLPPLGHQPIVPLEPNGATPAAKVQAATPSAPSASIPG